MPTQRMNLQTESFRTHALGVVFVLSLCFIVDTLSQSLRIAPQPNGRLQLNWEAAPLAPFARKPISVTYTVEESRDLQHWTSAAESIEITDTAATVTGELEWLSTEQQSFYRLHRVVNSQPSDWRRQDLRFGSLAQLNLQGMELAFSLVQGCDFTSVNLNGGHLFAINGDHAIFDNAQLLGADLSAAVLVRSQFANADLTGCRARFGQFTHSDFQQADLRFVDFTGSNLFNCDLRNADLRGAILLDANLQLARFHGSRLDRLNRIPPQPLLVWQIVNEGRPGANLARVDLARSNLQDANLRNANLTRANLSSTDLRGADLRGADLTGTGTEFVDFRGTLIDDTSLIPPRTRLIWEIVNTIREPSEIQIRNLSETILTDGHLQGFVLRGFNFRGAIMLRTNLSHADLTRANLTNAILRNADLRFADLTGANTGGADFSGALFENTILPDGSIGNSQ